MQNTIGLGDNSFRMLALRRASGAFAGLKGCCMTRFPLVAGGSASGLSTTDACGQSLRRRWIEDAPMVPHSPLKVTERSRNFMSALGQKRTCRSLEQCQPFLMTGGHHCTIQHRRAVLIRPIQAEHWNEPGVRGRAASSCPIEKFGEFSDLYNFP